MFNRSTGQQAVWFNVQLVGFVHHSIGGRKIMSFLNSFARYSFRKCLGSQNLHCFVLCPAPYISSGWVAMSVAPLVCHALLAPYMEGPQQTLCSTTPVTTITVIGHLGFKQHFCGFLSKIVFWFFDLDCRLRVSWPQNLNWTQLHWNMKDFLAQWVL